MEGGEPAIGLQNEEIQYETRASGEGYFLGGKDFSELVGQIKAPVALVTQSKTCLSVLVMRQHWTGSMSGRLGSRS